MGTNDRLKKILTMLPEYKVQQQHTSLFRLPDDPSQLSIVEIRKLLFRYTELFRWASQEKATRAARIKLLRSKIQNEVILAQSQLTKGFTQAERQIKAQHLDTVKEIDALEAEVLVYETLANGFEVAKDAVSREITIRTKG